MQYFAPVCLLLRFAVYASPLTQRIFLAVLIVLMPSMAFGDGELAAEELCSITTCREPGVAQVWLAENRYVEIQLEGSAIAYDANISLFPGDKYSIEADFSEGQISNLRPALAESTKSTISVSFEQEIEESGQIQTYLLVHNPFDYPLRYEAYMETEGGEEYQYTSSCPVQPGLMTYEQWQYPVVHLMMTEVRLLTDYDPAVGGIVCE